MLVCQIEPGTLQQAVAKTDTISKKAGILANAPDWRPQPWKADDAMPVPDIDALLRGNIRRLHQVDDKGPIVARRQLDGSQPR
jgi:hypothetical protein